MSVAQPETRPLVGHESAPGPRWFVTRYPELYLTVRPEDWKEDDNGKVRKVKAKRIAFQKEVKPRILRGTGKLERTKEGNDDPTDSNDLPWWGIYKTADPELLTFLRNHEYYLKTTQDNQLQPNGVSALYLKELSWNPDKMSKSQTGLVKRRVTPIGPDDDMTIPLPEETAPAPTRARIGARAKAAA